MSTGGTEVRGPLDTAVHQVTRVLLDLPDHLGPDVPDELRERMQKLAESIGAREPEADDRMISELIQYQRATHVVRVMGESTASIINTVAVFNDKESSEEEKASSVLKCFASFSQLAAVAGPVGLAVGTIVSGFLGMVSMILEAVGPHRESMIEQLEKILLEVNAQQASHDVSAARLLLERQEAAIETFDQASKTWEEVLATAPITSDITQFKLLVVAEWLSDPANKKVRRWEDIFVGYCTAMIEVFALHTLILDKLRPQDRKTLLAESRKFGEHVLHFLRDVRADVADLGEYWHVGEPNPYGYHARSFRDPQWSDQNIGHLGGIRLSPGNDRIWAYRGQDKRTLSHAKLDDEGKPQGRTEVGGMTGCTDLWIAPGTSAGNYHLLFTLGAAPTGANKPHAEGLLYVNQWSESNGKFTDGDFWRASLTNIGSVVMACDFKAAAPDTNTFGRYAYIVHQRPVKFELAIIAWQDLLNSRSIPAVFSTAAQIPFGRLNPVPDLPPTGGHPFRIAVSEHNLFVYWGGEIYRKSHDDVFRQLDMFRLYRESNGEVSQHPVPWQAVPGPSSGGKVQDLFACSDEGLLAVVDTTMWRADYVGSKWEWKKCGGGRGVKITRGNHESLELYERVRSVSSGYALGTALPG